MTVDRFDSTAAMRDGIEADNEPNHPFFRLGIMSPDEHHVLALARSAELAERVIAMRWPQAKVHEVREGWHFVIRKHADGSSSLRGVLDQRHTVPPLVRPT
jgi:hypothetical protein